MDRAVNFYEELLEQPVTEKDEVYSVFDIHGFRMGLFAYGKVGEEHEFGSNCLPSISVDSRKILERKIIGKEICFPLKQINNNWVVGIIDSEGNHVEMTAPVGSDIVSDPAEFRKNIDKLHTTVMGIRRIKRNLNLGNVDVVKWCRIRIDRDDTKIDRNGKNWYIISDDVVITVNAGSYTIITAHKKH